MKVPPPQKSNFSFHSNEYLCVLSLCQRNGLFLGLECLALLLMNAYWAEWRRNNEKKPLSLTSELRMNSFEHICSPGVSLSDAVLKHVGAAIANREKRKWLILPISHSLLRNEMGLLMNSVNWSDIRVEKRSILDVAKCWIWRKSSSLKSRMAIHRPALWGWWPWPVSATQCNHTM